MWLLVLVVGSGVFGLVVQNIVPRLMLERVPAETIFSQIGHILDQYRAKAERRVGVPCGQAPLGTTGATRRSGLGTAPSFLAMGTFRQVGRVQGRVVEVGVGAGYLLDSEPLPAFFRDQVQPYLRARSGTSLALASPGRAASLFSALKTVLRPEAHPVVDRLADRCDQRRQFDLRARLHGWLFTWLVVPVTLSVALLVLMIAHILAALKSV
ncbi:MAG TPA: hypothetical protein VFF52_16875 [Isosphaeraceae bacterium]|nr:hypothetical protein [Isosphaeraceae bacterium]